MIKTMKWLAGAVLAVTLAACGGGGGSPGATATGSGGGTGGGTGSGSGSGAATVTVSLVDSSGAPTTIVSSASTVFAKATVKDATGAPVSGTVVTFSGDSNARINFVPANGTALTDASGVATIQVAPESSGSAGAGVLTASATVGSASPKGTTSYQIPNAISDFVMLLDKSTLPNSGASTATLTLIAVDKSNNVVPNVPVSVATDANTIFTPASTTTDANGKFTGTLSIGSDKTDRTATITATVGGVTKKTTVQISGSSIALASTPTVLTPGAQTKLTARLTDSVGTAIPNSTITFSGDIPAISGQTVMTDANGNATVSFVAPTTPGSYVEKAAGSGVNTSLTIQVGAGAVIPQAKIPAGAVPALSALPNVVAPNAATSTSSQSQLRFLMLDSNNQPVPNVRVRFDIHSLGLGSSDSKVSSGSETVYTNASGLATAAFIPGATASPTDGVDIRACWQAADFTLSNPCDNWVDVTLTIAAQALAISIGDDNLLTRGDGTYIKKFTVTVADAAGRPVANAPVDIFLDIPYFEKGPYSYTVTTTDPTTKATTTTTTLGQTFPLKVQPYQSNQDVPADPSVDPVALGARVTCVNQDLNRNGVVDLSGPTPDLVTNKDGFGQWVLLPRKSDILISYADPNVTTTNASGILVIQVEYSQRFATWLEYHVRASTSVAGSQGTAERAFVTQFIKGDDTNGGSFLTPPYGIGPCNSPN